MARTFREIDLAHAAWCVLDDWTKENGRYAPQLANWLQDEGYRAMPPVAGDVSKVPDETDEQRRIREAEMRERLRLSKTKP